MSSTNAYTLFDEYFSLVQSPEVPNLVHRWSFVVLLSSVFERNVWLPFGNSRIFPNQFALIIGNPGARKSTGIKLARKIFDAAGFPSFASDKTSKEKFLLDLSEEGKKINALAQFDSLLEEKPCVARLVADEFLDLVGPGNVDFLTLLGNLWDYDDKDKPYLHSKASGKNASVYQPTVSLLGGATHETLAKAVPAESIGTGFASRMLLIYVRSTGFKEAWPEASDFSRTLGMQRRLAELGKLKGPMTVSPEAKLAGADIYKGWKEIEDSRFSYYGSRRYTHLLKNAMICALSRGSLEISKGDVVYANSYLTYAESLMPRAMGELGTQRGSAANQAVYDLILDSNFGIEASDIYKRVSTRLDQGTTAELSKILTTLENSGKIYYFDNKYNARILGKNKQIHSDWSLLANCELSKGNQNE